MGGGLRLGGGWGNSPALLVCCLLKEKAFRQRYRCCWKSGWYAQPLLQERREKLIQVEERREGFMEEVAFERTFEGWVGV